MNVAIEIPDAILAALKSNWGDVSSRARKAVAVEGYCSGALTAGEVGQFLGHSSRWETEAFLKGARAHLRYTESDLERDLEVLRETHQK